MGLIAGFYLLIGRTVLLGSLVHMPTSGSWCVYDSIHPILGCFSRTCNEARGMGIYRHHLGAIGIKLS